MDFHRMFELNMIVIELIMVALAARSDGSTQFTSVYRLIEIEMIAQRLD